VSDAPTHHEHSNNNKNPLRRTTQVSWY